MPSYNSDPNVQTLEKVLAQDSSLKGIAFVRALQLGARQNDDFSMLEGPEKSESPIYVREDLTKDGGDKMHFTVFGGLAGPGVRGEGELTGNTSVANYGSFTLTVDFWRDGVEMNKKKLKFMAAGGSVRTAVNQALRKKLGLQKQRDAMMALRAKASGNIIRPNGRRSRDAILGGEVLTPDFAIWAKAQAQRNGAAAINVAKDPDTSSPIHRFLCFATESAMLGVRQDDNYVQAATHAASRGDSNPLFSGRLTDWQNVAWFEHIVVDPDVQDTIGSPLSPRCISKVAFGANSASGSCKIVPYTSTTENEDTRLFTQDFPGYRYRWWEGASDGSDGSAVQADTNVYYAWGITPDGYVGFISYTGSAGNDGNTITVTNILTPAGASTSTKGSQTVGNLDCTGDDAASNSGTALWGGTAANGSNYAAKAGNGGGTGSNTVDTFTYTDYFPADTIWLAANAKGALIGHSFLFGRGALCRGYGSIRELPVEEMRDFGFVKGMGYESIFGQAPYARADGKTPNYALLEHAIEIPGLEVPSLTA